MNIHQYDDLLNTLIEIEDEIATIEAQEDYHNGDQHYQRLLERQSDIRLRMLQIDDDEED